MCSEHANCLIEIGSEHRMDPTTKGGLLDLLAVGHFLEFFIFTDAFLVDVVGPEEFAETRYANHVFSQFKDLFSKQHHVVIDAQPYHAFMVFGRAVVHFAVSLILYQEGPGRDRTCTRPLRPGIINHFKQRYPHLRDLLLKLLDEGGGFIMGPSLDMDWTGEDFIIVEGEVPKLSRSPSPSSSSSSSSSSLSSEESDEGLNSSKKRRISRGKHFIISFYIFFEFASPDVRNAKRARV